MDILVNVLLFAVGLVAIIKGADWLTDGAADIAKRFGIPTIVVGLTIVAMGSSMPEFVVSVTAAVKGNSDIALGNVVGSNIFNILGIMGITALVCPIKVDKCNIRYDVPFVIFAAVAVLITVFDNYIDGSTFTNQISRSDGLMLLCVFIVFMLYTISLAKKQNQTDVLTEEQKAVLPPMWRCSLLVLVGLALLIFGGDLIVDGASGIASDLGVSDAVIALTIVSAGTSAPELAASVMAAKKGDTAMALGNIVGSNVFNVFFILGVSALIRPISACGIKPFDIYAMLASAILLWLLCKFGKTYYTLTRAEGVLLIILAVVYYTCCVSMG